ncbi:MAG: hypothetical protein DBY32_04715 [Phascolarctobacterium sp.]|nr:MAG: hypothetical protein DBY32_04715 [Phascolarctobacterium sp.]
MPTGTINFPSTIPAPNYPLGEELEDSTLRSTFEDGTVQTRQKFTRVRTTYSVEWGNMPDEHKQTLESFYKNDVKGGALAFNWTHPQSGVTKNVRFTEPPKMSLSVTKYWSVSISLQEV